MQIAAIASDIEDAPLGKSGGGSNGGSAGMADSLKMLGALVIVAGVLWIGYKVLMKFSKRGIVGFAGSGKLKVLDSKAMSVKHSVVLLQAGKRVYVVGLSPTGMNKLGEISDEKEIEEFFITSKKEECKE